MTSVVAWQSWARDRIGQSYNSFAAQLGRAILHPGADEIHELRILIRRLRQALDLCQKRPRRTLRRALKNLMRIAGQLRDADIATRYFEYAGLTSLARASRRRRRKFEKDLARFLCRHARDLKVRSEEELKLSSRSATAKIQILARRMFAIAGQSSRPDSSLTQLHQARIAAKKLRYTLELFLPPTPPGEANPLEDFLKLQKLLGEIHDVSTVLASIPGRKSRLRHRLRLKQSRYIHEFQQFWAGQIQPNQSTLLRQWLQWVHLDMDPTTSSA